MADYLVVVINVGQGGSNAVAHQSADNICPGKVIQLQVVTVWMVPLVVEHVFQHFLGARSHYRPNHDFRVGAHGANGGANAQCFKPGAVMVADTFNGGSAAQIGFGQPVGNIEGQAVGHWVRFIRRQHDNVFGAASMHGLQRFRVVPCAVKMNDAAVGQFCWQPSRKLSRKQHNRHRVVLGDRANLRGESHEVLLAAASRCVDDDNVVFHFVDPASSQYAFSAVETVFDVITYDQGQ